MPSHHAPTHSYSSFNLTTHPKEEPSSSLSLPSKSTSKTSSTYSPRLSFESKFHHSSIDSNELLLHPNLKKILRTSKTLDLPNNKNILGKTSGTSKTFSSSHLGTPTCSKSKVKSTKHLKSSFKTKPQKTSTSTYDSASSHQGISSITTSLRLVHGEQSYLVILIFAILLLLYLFMIKTLHRPFDRGKESFIHFTRQ